VWFDEGFIFFQYNTYTYIKYMGIRYYSFRAFQKEWSSHSAITIGNAIKKLCKEETIQKRWNIHPFYVLNTLKWICDVQ